MEPDPRDAIKRVVLFRNERWRWCWFRAFLCKGFVKQTKSRRSKVTRAPEYRKYSFAARARDDAWVE